MKQTDINATIVGLTLTAIILLTITIAVAVTYNPPRTPHTTTTEPTTTTTTTTTEPTTTITTTTTTRPTTTTLFDGTPQDVNGTLTCPDGWTMTCPLGWYRLNDTGDCLRKQRAPSVESSWSQPCGFAPNNYVPEIRRNLTQDAVEPECVRGKLINY